MRTSTAHAAILTTTLLLTSCVGDTTQGVEPGSLDPSRTLAQQVGYNSFDPRLLGDMYRPGAVGTCEVISTTPQPDGADGGEWMRWTIERGRFGLTRLAGRSPKLCGEQPCVQHERLITYNEAGLVEHVQERTTYHDPDARPPAHVETQTRRYTWTDEGLLSSVTYTSEGLGHDGLTQTFDYTAGRLSSSERTSTSAGILNSPPARYRYELVGGDLRQLRRYSDAPAGAPDEELGHVWDEAGALKRTVTNAPCGQTIALAMGAASASSPSHAAAGQASPRRVKP